MRKPEHRESFLWSTLVVAANSPLEAHGVMCAEDESLTYWYEAIGWQEFAGVTADTETPCILAHGEHEG